MAEGKYQHLIDIIFAAKGVEPTAAKVKQIQKALGDLDKTAPAATGKMNLFISSLMRAAIVAPAWMLVRGAIQSVFGLIQSQIKFLIDMENAMARIQIVGKGTAEEYDNLKLSLIGLSLAYGTSASEALDAAVIFAQQGKTVAETFALTRAAMIGAKVLGTDVKTATEDLTAAMNAFGIPTQNAAMIIDQLINVEKEFAVTSRDLSEGIKVTGATANQVGVSMAALAGDITAVIEVTRKSGSEAARGLSFIYARLLTSGKPIIEQLTGINFYLDKQGKVTSNLTGTLRNATDILDELAGKWGNLTNEQRLQAAEALGSKRQMVVLNALMQNYTHSIDARIVALTSAGSAEKALAKLLDTTSYKITQLGSSWNAVTASLADTSAWKTTIDIMTSFLTSAAKVIDFEKGMKIELAKLAAGDLADVETKQNQISSIEELIKVRNKLLSEPPSDKTTERLNIITKAIDSITAEHPKIKLALESDQPENLKKAIADISDQLLGKKVIIQVGIDFGAQLKALEREKASLKEMVIGYAKKDWEVALPGIGKKLLDIDKKRVEILTKQRAEIDKQYIATKATTIEKTLQDEEAAAALRGELTKKEKEQLNIERELYNFKILQNATEEEYIQKQIELINNSKDIYLEHAKSLKLAELENQLIDAKLKKRDDELKTLADLAILYEKTRNPAERNKLERVAELTMQTPEEFQRTFEEGFDKNLIFDFWNTWNQEQKDAIAQGSEFYKDMLYRVPTINLQPPTSTVIKEPVVPVTNITNKGAEQINVYIQQPGVTPEEMAKLVEKDLLANKDFQNMWITKTREGY